MILVTEGTMDFKNVNTKRFNTMKESTQYLVEKGYIFDSDDEIFSYWFDDKNNYATIYEI